MKAIALFAAAAAATFAAGTSSAATRQQACQSYLSLKSSIANLRAMGPDSTVGDVQGAEKQVENSFRHFEQSASPYAGPQVQNLKSSIRQLADTTNNIPPSATVSQAEAMIKGDLARVQIARDQVLQQLGCPGLGSQGSQPEQPGPNMP